VKSADQLFQELHDHSHGELWYCQVDVERVNGKTVYTMSEACPEYRLMRLLYGTNRKSKKGARAGGFAG
jgi:hypothetical protein